MVGEIKKLKNFVGVPNIMRFLMAGVVGVSQWVVNRYGTGRTYSESLLCQVNDMVGNE